MRTQRLLAGVVLLAAWAWAPAVASAQPFEYAVKLVCGSPDSLQLAPGNYFTAINVHNPQREPTEFQFKVALTGTGVSEGPITGFTTARLRPDGALEIDCVQVRRMVERRRRLMKGFVVILSRVELDVVAVYTAGPAALPGTVTTMDVERVMPRSLRQ